MKKNWFALIGALILAVSLQSLESSAQRLDHERNRHSPHSPITLEYYASQGNPIGGVVEYANAQGEICQSGDVVITVRNPTYEYNGAQYPLHGDEANNAANLFCRVKGLSYATDVQKIEARNKVLTLEAHGDTFKIDGHRTTVSKVTCRVRVDEPCPPFNKDMLRDKR